MRTARIVVVSSLAFAVACGAASSRPANDGTEQEKTDSSETPPSPAASQETRPLVATPALSDAEILGKVQGDFASCYQRGKKAAPKMADGKVTFLASVAGDGKTGCVVPMNDTGLTQEVEDCMSARLGRETYDARAAWTFELPIAVRGGAIELGKEATGPQIDEIGLHGLSGATKVIQELMPKLDVCAQRVDPHSGLRVLHIGARVGSDGRVSCALATGASSVSEEVRECARRSVESVRFSAPTSREGLVTIPVKILGSG